MISGMKHRERLEQLRAARRNAQDALDLHLKEREILVAYSGVPVTGWEQLGDLPVWLEQLSRLTAARDEAEEQEIRALEGEQIEQPEQVETV